MPPLLLITALIIVALIFDFLNGFNDSGNIVATIISSRAMRPRSALTLSAVAHFCGPFLFGVAVATTVGHEIIAGQAVTVSVILAALSSAIVWNIFTWLLGIPSSSSHALVGGMVGAAVVDHGFGAIIINGLLKVLLVLFLSPLLGLMIGYLTMKLVLFLARGASPRVNLLFKRAQMVTSLALALSHGSNDSQKAMGIITMGLVATGYLSAFAVPVWVVILCAGVISLGAMFGGWRIIRTLGGKFYKIRPVHGFATQITSAAVVLGAALLGGPVSTTQVVSSSIMGVGAAERLSKVRWQVARDIAAAWVLTIPATALMAALFHMAIVRLRFI
ncbi:MAG: inorganic phosphate transporter [Chloroflexota bacterium]|nr:inorganic phosphate transporter [Chloroflexota bacterium]